MADAAVYVRASTDLQKYSTDNQTHALLQYAIDHHLKVVRKYEDDGRSGLNVEGRPALLQLLQDVLDPARGFEVLLVYDVSRWGRFQDTDESAHYEFLCRRAGVRVIYCAEPFDNDGSAMANIMKAIKRSMAAEYSRELSTKVAMGKRRAVEKGHAFGMPCFGMQRMVVSDTGVRRGTLQRGQRKAVQSDHLILVPGPPEEVAAVRWMFHMFVRQRLGYTHIAEALNAKGVRTARGQLWKEKAIRELMSNEQLIGTLLYGRTACRLQGERQNLPPETWVRIPNAFGGIISEPMFRRAQKRMAEGVNWRSKPELLVKLKALYQREGYLTAKLIDQSPAMPGSQVYLYRFGSLYEAYRRIGYHPPGSVRLGRPLLTRLEPEVMLERLRNLREREGYLNSVLLDHDPETPGTHLVRQTFGSLQAAYALIGYRQGRRRLSRSKTGNPPGEKLATDC